MVLVTDDWESFKREAATYIERARVFYRIETSGNVKVVKIACGKVAFEKEFDMTEKSDAELFKQVMDWIDAYGGFPVKRAVPDDIFFAESYV